MSIKTIYSCAVLLLIGSMVAACDSSESLTTNTPAPTSTLIIMQASETVSPLVPTANQAYGNTNADDFAPAANPTVVSGDAVSTITPSPVPTRASLPLQFVTSDGLTIVGTYYAAAKRPAPAVLLLHMAGGSQSDWEFFAALLQQAGYNVLAIDERGHGATGGDVDWGKAQRDTTTVLDRLRNLPGVDPNKISVIGASIGANLAITACATSVICHNVVLLSPALDYFGVKTSGAMTTYGKRPVMTIASRGDAPSGADSPKLDQLAQGDHRLLLFDGAVHGTQLLTTQTDLAGMIIQWLNIH